MNKDELATAIAEGAGLTKKDAAKALAATIDAIISTVGKNEKVQLVGFGTFECRDRAARTGRNPQTKEPIQIPASKLPVFKAGKAFKEAVDIKKKK